MSLTEKVLRAKDDLDAVYEAGTQAEYDRFWDDFQQNGTRTDYRSAFAGPCWSTETFKPKYVIRPVGNAERLFYYSTIKHLVTDKLDSSQTTNTSWMFAESAIEHIGEIDLTNVSNANGTFYYMQSLHTIDKLIVNPNGTTNFGGAGLNVGGKLRNITIEGTFAESLNMGWNVSLSRESIESIVNALSPTTSGLTLSLPRVAVENAYGSASEDEGDWYWVMMTKPNWSFALT